MATEPLGNLSRVYSVWILDVYQDHAQAAQSFELNMPSNLSASILVRAISSYCSALCV